MPVSGGHREKAYSLFRFAFNPNGNDVATLVFLIFFGFSAEKVHHFRGETKA